jgi:V-type H+-transporting ATPase subunit C
MGLADSKKKKKDGLEQKLQAHNRALSDICLAYFSEGYELYVHAKILRLVIESNMRFGSDPTVFYLLESMPGKDKIVQTMLIEIFGDKENEGLYGTKDEIDDAEDFFPFIYVPVITL